jgi:uncharacterized protein with PQ loop repeat
MAASIEVIANLMQSSIPVLSFTAYVPQWLRLMKTKSSASISLQAWFIWGLSAIFGTFYAAVQLDITGRGWPLLISCIATLIMISFTISMIIYYRPNPHKNQLDNM